MVASDTLKRTPLYEVHVAARARMAPFGGWEMPVQYTGILEEHAAVRERVGLFDISHMGQVLVAGPNAERMLNHLLTNDVRKLDVGQAQYTLLCHEGGGIIDDLIVYRVEPTVHLLVINASRVDKDFHWMSEHATAPVVMKNLSDKSAALALQGPRAATVLNECASIRHFHVERRTLSGVSCWAARTGYTGEDGFELLCDASDAARLWSELLSRGAAQDIRPCGLGARDILRLEMCYPLHGNDITEKTTPLEAGLGKYVSFDKGEFVGSAVLKEQKANGVLRKLTAFSMMEKSPPPRPHYPIFSDKTRIGEVTSGTQSPSLAVGIGMGYVEHSVGQIGSTIHIEIRGKHYPAVIKPKPLWKRTS